MKNIKLIFGILFVFLLTNCETPNVNTKKTITWLNEHPKPIVTHGTHSMYYKRYILIDAEGNSYSTGNIDYFLPDTIKKYYY